MTKRSRVPADGGDAQQPKRSRVRTQSTNAKETRSVRSSSSVLAVKPMPVKNQCSGVFPSLNCWNLQDPLRFYCMVVSDTSLDEDYFVLVALLHQMIVWCKPVSYTNAKVATKHQLSSRIL